jgi:hypothetical protein
LTNGYIGRRARGASFEESCIRKAGSERGLNTSPGGLADANAEDEAAMGAAFALM